MLVVTRKCNEKVVFPSLGISVTVLRSARSNVRLGIDAPAEVAVHRNEVAQRIEEKGSAPATLPLPAPQRKPPRLNHAVRHHLSNAALGLHTLHRMLESHELDDAEATILKVFNELKGIEGELDQNNEKYHQATTNDHRTTESHPDPNGTGCATLEIPEARSARPMAVNGGVRREINVPIGPQGVDQWLMKPVNSQKHIRAHRQDLPIASLST